MSRPSRSNKRLSVSVWLRAPGFQLFVKIKGLLSSEHNRVFFLPLLSFHIFFVYFYFLKVAQAAKDGGSASSFIPSFISSPGFGLRLFFIPHQMPFLLGAS